MSWVTIVIIVLLVLVLVGQGIVYSKLDRVAYVFTHERDTLVTRMDGAYVRLLALEEKIEDVRKSVSAISEGHS